MEAFVLLGSNIRPREKYIEQAIGLLGEVLGQPLRKSKLYASQSWGFDGNDFLNQLVVYDTDMQPFPLLNLLLDVEKRMGRQRLENATYSNRNIDIDLLYLDNLIYQSPELILPHPRLHLRRFTLMPLAELAPQMLHPLLGKSHLQLLADLEDESRVWHYAPAENQN